MIFQSYVMGNCASRAITCGFSFRFEFSVKKEPQDKKSDEQKAATGSRKDTNSTPEASEGSRSKDKGDQRHPVLCCATCDGFILSSLKSDGTLA